LRRACVLAAAAALLLVPGASADGDPASDVLLSNAVFASPNIPVAYVTQLADTLREAKARGYQARVAIITSTYDLGAVTALWRQPERYARFLGQELFFVYKGRLLVVMPNGYGFSRDGKPVPAEQAVVDGLPPPGSSDTALASAATNAVTRLAAHAGVVVRAAKLGAHHGSSGNRSRILFGVAGAALVVALLVAVYPRWRRA